MTKRTHIAVGVATGVFLFHIPNVDIITVATEIVSFTAGAIFPDMDVVMGMKYENTPLKHRGILHALITPAIVTLVGYVLMAFMPEIFSHNTFYNIILPFVGGILLHLFLDSMTVMGIQPLIPFSYKKFNLFGRKGKYGRGMRVGSIWDTLLAIFAVLLIVFLLYTGYNISGVIIWAKKSL